MIVVLMCGDDGFQLGRGALLTQKLEQARRIVSRVDEQLRAGFRAREQVGIVIHRADAGLADYEPGQHTYVTWPARFHITGIRRRSLHGPTVDCPPRSCPNPLGWKIETTYGARPYLGATHVPEAATRGALTQTLGTVERPRCAHKCQVRKGLWEVTSHARVRGVVLLGEEP